MVASIEQRSQRNVREIVGKVRQKGVRLWSRNGKLHYKAPRGALNAEDMESLRALSAQIVTLLETGANQVEPVHQTRGLLDCQPLTFSQFKYWHADLADGRPTIRTIASATRLGGRLDRALLEACIEQMVHRHEALRTRIVTHDGAPVQLICDRGDCDFQFHDLTSVSPHERPASVERIVQQLILEPIDVALGPLFGARLLRLASDEHVLALALEHVISDAFSMNILLGDLCALYTQRAQNRPVSLPPVSVQVADYAVWQRNRLESWLHNHGSYWNERLAGCGRLSFPRRLAHDPARGGLATVPVVFPSQVRTELVEWSKLRRTTLVTSVFTAFVAIVLRWCDVSYGVIRYQSDGRVHPKVAHTIGYLASVLNLRMELTDGDTFLDLLERVKREYYEAQEHADLSYLDAQLPTPDFVRNPGFNWVPQPRESVMSELARLDGPLKFSRYDFEFPRLESYRRDHEPLLVLYDRGDTISGNLCFPRHRFADSEMNAFSRNFSLFVQALLARPEQRIADIGLQLDLEA